jgi:hypothetical protein
MDGDNFSLDYIKEIEDEQNECDSSLRRKVRRLAYKTMCHCVMCCPTLQDRFFVLWMEILLLQRKGELTNGHQCFKDVMAEKCKQFFHRM